LNPNPPNIFAELKTGTAKVSAGSSRSSGRKVISRESSHLRDCENEWRKQGDSFGWMLKIQWKSGLEDNLKVSLQDGLAENGFVERFVSGCKLHGLPNTLIKHAGTKSKIPYMHTIVSHAQTGGVATHPYVPFNRVDKCTAT
jgi:hypothetical protein